MYRDLVPHLLYNITNSGLFALLRNETRLSTGWMTGTQNTRFTCHFDYRLHIYGFADSFDIKRRMFFSKTAMLIHQIQACKLETDAIMSVNVNYGGKEVISN
ncbi:unnamed protein product [Cuscuta epithymum]|uniref:DNA-directed RNA polymerase n=1 Tax=Cuscuta epithymum TaxID=186058 RepID=A0AAV0GM97_9ASTE|nr:unnamed protein product [Cuscuta epithymum]CAH9148830.1 unnamed protein product [Cuscuta epithymum]